MPQLTPPLAEGWLDHVQQLALECRTLERSGQAGARDTFWSDARRPEAEAALGRPATDVEFAALERATRAVVTLLSMPRRSAPAELDGRIVASLHAGHRQSRAVSYVESLPAMTAPVELDRALDRLIEGSSMGEGGHGEDVESSVDVQGDLPTSEDQLLDFAATLPRAQAPDELDQRVDGSISRQISSERGRGWVDVGSVRRVGSSISRWAGALALAAAAVAVTFVGARLLSMRSNAPRVERSMEHVDAVADAVPAGATQDAGRDEDGGRYPEFVIETVDPSDLNSADRWLVGGLSGAYLGGQG